MNDSGDKKKITAKQIAAIIGIVLLVLLYVTALAAAILGNPASNRLFFIALYGTVVIPVMVWIYTWLYGKLTGKRNFTDYDGESEPVSEAEEDPDSRSSIQR